MIKCPECGHLIRTNALAHKIVKDKDGVWEEIIYKHRCPECGCEFKEVMRIVNDVIVTKHGDSKMNYYLAVFDERNGETTTTLFKIIKASNTDKAEEIARQDALENSIWDVGFESIRKLKYIQQIQSLDDIPSPFMLKE